MICTRIVSLLPLLVTVVATLNPAYSQSPGDIIISEVMEDPDGVDDVDGEYIEVYNATGSGIDLNGWTLKDESGSHTFNSSVVVSSDGFAVLCRNETPSENGGIACAAEYSGPQLANSGDSVVLEDGNGNTIDTVAYDEGTWPAASGASMEFIGTPGVDNNVPGHWQEATVRAGDFSGGSGDYGSPNANAENGSLPVELADFDVTADRDRAIVRWGTAGEKDNAGFAVEHRSHASDGWTELGYVPSDVPTGTTTQPQSYRYRTEPLRSGVHHFRLKQVDADGTGHLSETRTVRIAGNMDFRLTGPNPVESGRRLTAIVQVEHPQPVEISLYDVLGHRVRTITTGGATTNRAVKTTISTDALASGVYFLRVQGASINQTRRITVVR